MPSETEQPSRTIDLSSVNAENDGFQRVLTSSERRGLKKRHGDVKRVTLADCNALESSILSRLKKRGLDLANDPDHTSLETSTVENDEMATMVAELDEAMAGLMLDAQKPDQNLTVTELDNRIRTARTNLSHMKSRKKGTFSNDELENATKETDVYIAYLQQQIALTREYQKLKAAHSSMMRLKGSLKECLALRARPKVDRKATTPSSDVRVLGTTKRSLDYVCEFIKEMKDKHGQTFDPADLTTQDFRLADGTKFLPPYTFMQKLKQKFQVFIDKSGTKPMLLSVYGCTADVNNCLEYLAALDLTTQTRVPMTFAKFRPLLDLESKYNLLLNYNAGNVDVLGSEADVKSFMEHLDSTRELSRKDSGRDSKETVDKDADVTDLTTDKDRLFDYYVLRALSGKFRANVRELETEYGVGIKFDLTPRNGLAKVSFVPLLDYPVDKCVQRFTSYVDEYGHRELGKLTPEELAFLSDNDVLKKRYRSQYTTLVKAADRVFVVGLKKHLNFGFNRAQLLLESRLLPPYRFKISSAQYHVLLPHLQALQDQKGVFLTTTPLSPKDAAPRDAKDGSRPEKEPTPDSADKEAGGEKQLVLYVYGNSTQQKESVSALNDMLVTFTTRDVALSGVEYNLLVEDKSLLTSLEAKFKVKTTLTKTLLTLSGPKSQAELFVDELNSLFAKVVYLNLDDHAAANAVKNDSSVYAALLVPQRSLGKIIGKGGSTLKQIMLQSSITTLVITKAFASAFAAPEPEPANSNSGLSNNVKDKKRGKEVDVLLLVGTGLSVFFTIGLVKQVVDSDEEVPSARGDGRSLYDEYTSKHSILRRTTSNSSTSTSAAKLKSDEKLDINDLHNFPSL